MIEGLPYSSDGLFPPGENYIYNENGRDAKLIFSCGAVLKQVPSTKNKILQRSPSLVLIKR